MSKIQYILSEGGKNQKQVLMILDNIEDLLNNEIAGQLKFTNILEQILGCCEGVKLLCTTRKKIETEMID